MMRQRSEVRRASHAPTSSLDLYLREIQCDALLTSAEETSLALAIAAGDRDAKARMIRANLRLVVKIARDYMNRGLSLEDLIGEGNLGLIRACQEFNPSYNVRFCTYAAHWIKQSIRHALTNTTATIRLPAHMVGILGKWRRAERLLARDLGREPRPDEIVAHLGLTSSQRELVAHALRSSHLCRDGVRDDEDSWCSDEATAPLAPPDAALEAAEDRRELMRRLERLDDRERAVVTLRYGLGGGTPMTLREVGRKLGVTREWVRKIELRAVRKLDDDYAPPETRPTSRRRRVATSTRSRAVLPA
jgi:RNA polymerase primary sigma factor